MLKQQPTAGYLRFCRVASVAYLQHCRTYSMVQQQGYYNALLCCSNTGNKAVAALQAKGFVFTASNTRALVQHLLAGYVHMGVTPAQWPAQPGAPAPLGLLPVGCAVALRKLGPQGVLGVAKSFGQRGPHTLHAVQQCIGGW